MSPFRLSNARLAMQARSDSAGSPAQEVSCFHGIPLLGPDRLFNDRYRVSVLVRGGMSMLHLATDISSGKKVIIKIPRVSNSLSALASEESIARESAALSRLSHPNIPALVEHGVAGGFRFVVLEYIRGADLHTHLDKGEPIPWPMALHISSQVCDALKAAHDGGIAHGDIKPENILISSERSPAVFLLDFGLARSLNSTDDMRGDTDIVLGTLDYMAPEALERGIITPLSDMYSLGVLMYEMLAGWNPFYGKDEWETIDRVLALDPSPPGAWLSLPSALDSVVMRAISKDPAKRFQSAAELKAAILSVSSRDTWL